MSSIIKRLIWTVIIIVLLTVSSGPVAEKLQFEKKVFSDIDSTATKYVDASLKRAGTAFLAARTFNATVSVFQESELQLEPGGVGVSIALGQALDPINDLVERFSWVMLASLTSLGIQKFLIEMSPFISVQIVLLLALFSFLIGLWLPMSIRNNFTKLGQILLIAAIIIRFAVPVMAYLNNQIYTVFLQEPHDNSINALNQTVSDLQSQQLNDTDEEQDYYEGETDPKGKKNWWSFPDLLNGAKHNLNIKEKVEKIKDKAQGLVEKIVDLIVVFVLSTIVLPLLFLWGILKFGQLIISRKVNLFSINKMGRDEAPLKS